MTATPADRSNSPPIISSATPHAMMPIVELPYSTVASASASRNGGATTQEEDEDADRADQRAHLGTDQQALSTVSFLDTFVADDLAFGEVEICILCTHQRVPPFAYSATASMLDLSMNDGPVSVGLPPPIMFPLVR